MPCVPHCSLVRIGSCILLLILPIGGIAFFLIFPFILIPRREVAIIVLVIVPFVMLVVGTLFVPLVQLLLQLLIALGEPLDCHDEGLHFPFQGVGGVSDLLDDGSY